MNINKIIFKNNLPFFLSFFSEAAGAAFSSFIF